MMANKVAETCRHHLILLLLVEHRASIKGSQALRSPAIPLTSLHDLLVLLYRISFSIVLRHVIFVLPLLLYPQGFQFNAVFSIAPASLRNVCPIQFHFLLFIWFSINFCWVILNNSSFVILSVHFMFIVRLKNLFTHICKLLPFWVGSFPGFTAYNNTAFTFVVKIRILTYFDMLRFLHTGHSWTNTPFAFLILLATSWPKHVADTHCTTHCYYSCVLTVCLIHISWFCDCSNTKGITHLKVTSWPVLRRTQPWDIPRQINKMAVKSFGV